MKSFKEIGQLGDIKVIVHENSGNPTIFMQDVTRNKACIYTKATNIEALIRLLAEAANLDIVINERSTMNTPVKTIRYSDLPDGTYHLTSSEHSDDVYAHDSCVVELYTNPDSGQRGLGFNIRDGGGFMPLYDLKDTSTLTPMMTRTPFVQVSEMNTAFGNLKGDPNNIDWNRLEAQCKNILDEYKELMGDPESDDPDKVAGALKLRNLHGIRDALCDIQVFSNGAQHFIGVDGDDDMTAVVTGVMTRFCKDQPELDATIAKWEGRGLEIYVEGEFPRKIVKSAKDQPDAPKGKFLKSTGYTDTVFKQY